MRVFNKFFGQPSVKLTPRKPTSIFIPGSFAFFCHRCYGAVSMFSHEDETRCPRCHSTLTFIATALRGPMEPPQPPSSFLRGKPTIRENMAPYLTRPEEPRQPRPPLLRATSTVHGNVAAFLTGREEPPDAA